MELVLNTAAGSVMTAACLLRASLTRITVTHILLTTLDFVATGNRC